MTKPSENRNSRGSTKKVSKAGRNGDPISLYPLSPEEAMRRLLRVPPEPKEQQQAEQAKKRN